MMSSNTRYRAVHADDCRSYSAYIGLDVHKETITISVAYNGRKDPEHLGEIPNNPESVRKLVARLNKQFACELLLFCYEAGPCGYVLYRQLLDLGHHCMVVAPSRIPKIPGERVKTDRRDASKLARMLRRGDLPPVWVPDKRQEAMRDLVRLREDVKDRERKVRQQLKNYLQRHGFIWSLGRKRWTKAHYNWLEGLKFPDPTQQIVLQGYIDDVKAASRRLEEVEVDVERAREQWYLAPVVESLIALRGVDRLSATVLLAELGDLSRFDTAPQFAAFLGLVPSEHTSGGRRRQGGITKMGNSRARRTLVECAWSYRFPARKTMHMRKKAENASEEARQIANATNGRIFQLLRYDKDRINLARN